MGFTPPQFPTGNAIKPVPSSFSFAVALAFLALAFLVVIPAGDLLFLVSLKTKPSFRPKRLTPL
jgi:hypothetical protein